MEKKASVGKIHMTAKERNDRMFAGALLLPSVLITVIFILIPVADSVVKSFLSYKVKNIISGTPGEWNNFANYIKLFQNGKLGMAIVHTLLFVAAVVVAQFLLGMALALILNADIRFSRFVRSIMSVIKITVSMSIIENFKQFPLFWTMTGGGPDNATTTLAILSYREAFVSNNLGSGAAVTTIWMLLMIVVVFIYNRIFKAVDMD